MKIQKTWILLFLSEVKAELFTRSQSRILNVFLCSAQGTGIKTSAALNRMLTSSESVSNLSDTESMKKNRREMRLGDRVLVRSSVLKPTTTAGFRASHVLAVGGIQSAMGRHMHRAKTLIVNRVKKRKFFLNFLCV